VSQPPAGIRVFLLDIEGTTTPMAFVHELLFDYARDRLNAYLSANVSTAVVPEFVTALAKEHEAETDADQPPPWRDASSDELRASVAAYVRWLMARDRKSPALKKLQGLIWEEGYQAGDLRGEVFDDVPRAFQRWRKSGRFIAIYSSGSELAQRRLFGSTRHGDLTLQIAGFFDTAVGPKKIANSYLRIAEALDSKPAEVLFVSDVTAELTAAREAGCDTRLCMRPGNAPQDDEDKFEKISSFDELM
jgi:2,3-diketo-5-methylthio-1-phosphopentane phosphatase